MAEAGKITSVMELDASKYKKGMEESATVAVDSSAKRVNAAKKAETAEEKAAATAERNAQREARAKKEQANAAAFAAKFEGDAVQEKTIRIVTLAAQEKLATRDLATARKLERDELVDSATAARTTAAAYERLAAVKLELAAATKVEAAAEAHGVSDRMAASSVVRGLETGNVGIRSVENFLTTIPGASKVLQGAFSVIGPVAFAAAVFEGGKALYDMEQKAIHAKDAIAQAFVEQDQKARLVTDDLVIQADKLRDERDLLSGHPNDGLATALDEARKRADKLLESLQAARKEEEAIFKDNEVGLLAGMFSGVASTGRQGKEFLKDNKTLGTDISKIDDDAIERRQATKDPKAIKAINEEATRLKRERFAKEETRATSEAARLRQEDQDSLAASVESMRTGGRGSPVVDNTAKIQNAEGVARMMRRARLNETALQDVDDLQPQVDALKGQKKGAEEAKKEDEKRLKADEAALAAEKLLHSMSVKQTYDFWEEKRGKYAAGSVAYQQIVEKEAQLAVESATKEGERIKEWKKKRDEQASEDQIELPRMLNRNAEDMRKGAVKEAGERNQDDVDSNMLAMETARNILREREAFLNTAAGKTMTEYGVAMAKASAHADEFRIRMVALQAELDLRKYNESLDPSKENKARTAAAQRSLDQAKSERGMQMGQDSRAMHGNPSNAMVGASDALREFVMSTQDAAAEMKRFTAEGLRGFNDTLLKLMTGQTGRGGAGRAFQDFGSHLFSSAGGSLLQGGEGKLMHALGAGQGTGQGLAKFFGSHAGGFGSFIAKMLGGVGSAAAGVSGGGADSGLTSLIPMLDLPAFASGTPDFGGGMAMVGELGPELVNLPPHSSVTPNNQLSKMGGGGDVHYHIDASGSQDEAKTVLMVKRAVIQARQLGARDGAHAVEEIRKRRPM